ncbi:tetratricopeptide repeat protein [Streptomyces sp. NPDC050703]|uniref:tetratricopeptide repeat protein n=1 Tax=Streptomyces sp. NPDC050703 TaxID=3157218 RepID=UPI0034241AD2
MKLSMKHVLAASVAGSLVLGGVLVLSSSGDDDPVRPALGPSGRAMAAVGAGRPAALPDLTALIREREAHLRAHPGDGHSWAVLGSAYVARGERTADFRYYPRAEKALRTSLQAMPERNPEALTGLAALANVRHDFRAARTFAERAARQAPKRWTVYPALIDAHSGLGDVKAADKALEKLKALGPRSAVKARAGWFYRDRGWREDANSALSTAMALAATPAERAAASYRLGQTAWERGEPRVALRYYKAALAADADHHPSLAGEGRALAALGRTSQALRAYRSALARQPLPEYALELGELYQSLKLRPAARAQYADLRERVRQTSKGGVNDQRVLGLYEADHGDAEIAVQRLTAEYAVHPNPETADALGWALHRSGDSEAGLKYVTKAIKKGPRSALFAYHRGEIERELGEDGAARRHLREALLINPYFSPLAAPAARSALKSLGEPAEGGPEQVYAPPGEKPAPLPKPKPEPSKRRAASDDSA